MVRCSDHSTGPVCQPILDDATSPELRLFYPMRRMPITPQVANHPDFGFYRFVPRQSRALDLLYCGEMSSLLALDQKGWQFRLDYTALSTNFVAATKTRSPKTPHQCMVPTAGIYPGPSCSTPLDLHAMAVKGGADVFNGHEKQSSNTTGINPKAWHSRTPGHSGARPLRSSHVVHKGSVTS